MAAWGCRTFITTLNIGIALKGFHQYVVRTKYWRHFELQFLFSVNCINSLFPLILGQIFIIIIILSKIFCGVVFVHCIQECFSHHWRMAAFSKFSLSSIHKRTILNRRQKKEAEDLPQVLLEIPHCRNELLMRKFLRNMSWLYEEGEAATLPAVPVGQGGTAASWMNSASPLLHLNLLVLCLPMSYNIHTQVPNLIWANAVTITHHKYGVQRMTHYRTLKFVPI